MREYYLFMLMLETGMIGVFVFHLGMQFEQSVPWIPSLGIQYHVGIDGISLFSAVEGPAW